MFRPLIALLLLLLSCASIHAAEPVAIGQHYQLRSQVLEEDRSYRVYLPATYRWATNRRYPVLFLLDGQMRSAMARPRSTRWPPAATSRK